MTNWKKEAKGFAFNLLVIAGLIASVILAAKIQSCGSKAHGAELLETPNFIAIGPEGITQKALDASENQRKQVSVDWFGEELPPSVGRTIVNIEVGRGNQSLTWPIDNKDRRYHKTWVRGDTKEIILSGAIPHEIAHTVLFTWRPVDYSGGAGKHTFPLWINEGIACYYESTAFYAQRQRVIGWMVRQSDYAAFNRVFGMTRMGGLDIKEYAVASSVVEYLVQLRDKRTVVRFGDSVMQKGVDKSLRDVYGIGGVEDLKGRWVKWLD